MKTRIDEAYEKGVYDGQRGNGLDDFSESDTADAITFIIAPPIAILSNLLESDEEEAYKKGYEYGMKHRYDKDGNRYHEPYPEDEEIKEEKERSSSQDDGADTDSAGSSGFGSFTGDMDNIIIACVGLLGLVIFILGLLALVVIFIFHALFQRPKPYYADIFLMAVPTLDIAKGYSYFSCRRIARKLSIKAK